MNKVIEIIKSWSKSRNPSEEEKELAKLRYEICLGCPEREEKLGYDLCGACGCPLDKKVFSPNRQNACPLNKWKDVDRKFQ